MSGVTVWLQNSTGARYSNSSDTTGYYEIDNVPYDTYTSGYAIGSTSGQTTSLVLNQPSVKQDITVQATRSLRYPQQRYGPGTRGYAAVMP